VLITLITQSYSRVTTLLYLNLTKHYTTLTLLYSTLDYSRVTRVVWVFLWYTAQELGCWIMEHYKAAATRGFLKWEDQLKVVFVNIPRLSKPYCTVSHLVENPETCDFQSCNPWSDIANRMWPHILNVDGAAYELSEYKQQCWFLSQTNTRTN
jgi:hypothetical protein